MLNVFQVGNQETHRVEIDQPFIGRLLTVRVDDKVVVTHKANPLKFSHTIPFSIGVDEIHNAELRINYLASKYEAYLDGKLFIANLFPQAIGYNAFILAQMAFVMALFSCLTISLLITVVMSTN